MTALEAIGETLFALSSGAVLSAVVGIYHGRQIRKLEARIAECERFSIQATKTILAAHRAIAPLQEKRPS